MKFIYQYLKTWIIISLTFIIIISALVAFICRNFKLSNNYLAYNFMYTLHGFVYIAGIVGILSFVIESLKYKGSQIEKEMKLLKFFKDNFLFHIGDLGRYYRFYYKKSSKKISQKYGAKTIRNKSISAQLDFDSQLHALSKINVEQFLNNLEYWSEFVLLLEKFKLIKGLYLKKELKDIYVKTFINRYRRGIKHFCPSWHTDLHACYTLYNKWK